MLAKYLLSVSNIFISEKTLIASPIALETFYVCLFIDWKHA